MALLNAPLSPLLVILLSSLAGCQAQLTQAEKQEALDFHNHLRRNVVPRAADMNALFWDDKLANLAQQAANSCRFEHNYGGEYASLGENLYRGHRRNFSEILMMMFLERELYNYTSNACTLGANSTYPMFRTCFHYFQLASAGVNRVGCGIALCESTVYLAVCEYDKYLHYPPYQTGQPGTKCGHSYASWHYNDLCYMRKAIGPPPIEAPLDCRIQCLNYGTKINVTGIHLCYCNCPEGYTGLRCEVAHTAVGADNSDCMSQLVTCENGGVPTMGSDSKCRCQCSPEFEGDRCQVNIVQEENSVFWYFGQQMRYNSYYPVNLTNWESLGSAVMYAMTDAINEHCATNFSDCCPELDHSTTNATFVEFGNFGVTDNYPAPMLDGSMKVGVHFTMREEFEAECNFATSPLINKRALLLAAAKAFPSVANYTVEVNVNTLRYN